MKSAVSNSREGCVVAPWPAECGFSLALSFLITRMVSDRCLSFQAVGKGRWWRDPSRTTFWKLLMAFFHLCHFGHTTMLNFNRGMEMWSLLKAVPSHRWEVYDKETKRETAVGWQWAFSALPPPMERLTVNKSVWRSRVEKMRLNQSCPSDSFESLDQLYLKQKYPCYLS